MPHHITDQCFFAMDTTQSGQVDVSEIVQAISSDLEQTQVRAISSVNAEMLFHYWKVGHFILYLQRQEGWGAKTIENLSQAIKRQYPHRKGYSPRNLAYMIKFANTYPLDILQAFIRAEKAISKPSVECVQAQVSCLNEIVPAPILLPREVKNKGNVFIRLSPSDLSFQGEQGSESSISSLSNAIPQEMKNQGVVILQDPLAKLQGLGQLNFYVNVVDDRLRGELDNKTIGLLLCKGGDRVVAQYSLAGYEQPIGVSDYQFGNTIPNELRSVLPSIQEVETELSKLFAKQ